MMLGQMPRLLGYIWIRTYEKNKKDPFADRAPLGVVGVCKSVRKCHELYT
jgi:hypothetical protein